MCVLVCAHTRVNVCIYVSVYTSIWRSEIVLEKQLHIRIHQRIHAHTHADTDTQIDIAEHTESGCIHCFVYICYPFLDIKFTDKNEKIKETLKITKISCYITGSDCSRMGLSSSEAYNVELRFELRKCLKFAESVIHG